MIRPISGCRPSFECSTTNGTHHHILRANARLTQSDALLTIGYGMLPEWTMCSKPASIKLLRFAADSPAQIEHSTRHVCGNVPCISFHNHVKFRCMQTGRDHYVVFHYVLQWYLNANAQPSRTTFSQPQQTVGSSSTSLSPKVSDVNPREICTSLTFRWLLQ